MDLKYIFVHQARDYSSSTWKKRLGLGSFITRVAAYFRIDTSTTRHCSASMIALDHTIPQNKHMIWRVGDHYIIRDAPIDDPPAPKDKIPEELQAPICQVRHQAPDDHLKSSSIPTYHPRNSFECFVDTNMLKKIS